MTSTLWTEKVLFSLTHSDNVEHEELKIKCVCSTVLTEVQHTKIPHWELICAAQLISSLCRFAWRSLRPKHDWIWKTTELIFVYISWSRLPFFSWWKHLLLFYPFKNHRAIINQYKLYWYGILRALGEAIDRTLEQWSLDWF